MTPDVTFFFDPTCPFTWRTSRWLSSVTSVRELTVGWRLMSLAVLNEGKEIPEQYRDGMARSWLALRLLQATGERHGQQALAALYTEIGTRLHERGESLDTALLTDSLAAAGLPADLIAATQDAGLDPAIKESHQQGQALVGDASGSPITALGDLPGFFGPVVVPVPGGESAEKLFDALRLLSSVPEFSELKRARAQL